MEAQQAQGFDIPNVEAWVRDNVATLEPPFEWTQLQGGHSNLTYLLHDQHGHKAVIRRPPLGKLLPKAHDMAREWALISCLDPTGFLVPAALGFCGDHSVTGAAFYLMGFSEGCPLHSAEQTAAYVGSDKRQTLAYSFIDTLAQLHSLDPDEIGLGSLAKKDGYISRQVNTWYRSWQASIEPAAYDDGRAHELKQAFLDAQPEQNVARIVHGDYGFHNCLIGSDAQVSAVVDWEIATLGEPLADLGYALRNWPESPEDIARHPDAPTAVSGLPLRSELAERYARITGLSLDMLNYYISFNHWKSAAILHGVYARYKQGNKSSQGVNLDKVRASIDASLEAAVDAMNRLNNTPISR